MPYNHLIWSEEPQDRVQCITWVKVMPGGGAVKYEVDTGVRPALQQAGAFGESTGSKNEGSLGESMIFGIQ